MRAGARIAAFAAAVGVTFGAAALAGASLDPLRDEGGGGRAHESGTTAAHGDGHPAEAVAATLPGLAVSEDGHTLAPERSTLPLDRQVDLRFRILGPDGEVVTGMETTHERRMHLIVVRRDLTGYQHLHPTLDATGVWSVGLRLPAAGVYRAYADFRAGGRSMTLATDLFVAGPFTPATLPAPSPVDEAGGYRAELSARGATSGTTAELAYGVSRDGRMLDDIEPYLGADGHLVALREGDLAFLHVHPEESGARGVIRFGASLPSAGRYRLFLQFRHDGRMHTVAHTLEVTR